MHIFWSFPHLCSGLYSLLGGMSSPTCRPSSLPSSTQEVDAIYRVVAGVLHLQALRWVPRRDTAFLPPEERPWLSCVAEMWGIDADALYTHLVSTTSHVRGDVFTVQVWRHPQDHLWNCDYAPAFSLFRQLPYTCHVFCVLLYVCCIAFSFSILWPTSTLLSLIAHFLIT